MTNEVATHRTTTKLRTLRSTAELDRLVCINDMYSFVATKINSLSNQQNQLRHRD